MSGRLDATERGILIRVEEDPAPRAGVSSRSARHALAAVQAVDDGNGSAVYAEGHATAAPAVLVRGYGPLLRVERWDGTKWVLSATLASDGTLDVEDLTIAGAPLVGGSLDQDLVDIAALTPSNNDVLQRKTGAWTNRTPAQLLTDLLAAGLQTTLDGKQALDADLTTIAGLTATTDNFIVSVSSAWASRTPAQVKSTLALNNVDNTSDANKPVSTATQTALDLKGDLAVTANSQSGTTYTLVIGDQDKVIECNNGSAITLTIPANADVAFPTGTIVEVYQQGAGQVTVAAAGGVTLRAPGGAKTRVQYSTVTLRKRATNEWVLAGDTTS